MPGTRVGALKRWAAYAPDVRARIISIRQSAATAAARSPAARAKRSASISREDRRRWRECPGWVGNCCRVARPNRAELALAVLIEDLGFRFVGDGKFWIGRKNPDFVHGSLPVIVEMFGQRFHGRDDGRTRRRYLARRGHRMVIVRECHLKNPAAVQRRVTRALGR
jgi:G:T-mismatch repair DNA endonuclease (very short patch repair protein)